MNAGAFFKTRRRATLSVTFIAYTLLMLFGGCANKLILFPSRQPIDALTAHAVEIPAANGRIIQAWVDRSPGGQTDPQAYVIEFTGNATRAEQVATYAAARWGERPVEVWMINYPGYGGSSGDAELSAIAPTALAAYDHVAKIANGKPVYAAGNSLGTTAALYLATQRPIQGLVLQNPPAIRSLILSNFGWWNLWLLAGPVALQVPDELNSPQNAAKVSVPAIFILADDDTFVVPANQMKTVNAYAGPRKIIHTSGGHNDGISGEALKQLDADLNWLIPG